MPFDFVAFLKNTPNAPGVYQFFDKNNHILYVGKAKNLKARLNQYRGNLLDSKTIALTQKIHSITLTVTSNEDEALVLENNLIKNQKPPYNILLKDDKSYPYIVLTRSKFPRIITYRGKKNAEWLFFGPYPNAEIAKKTLEILVKLFKIRTCSDAIFKNRTRPCLKYQIDQCSAPCVNLIDQQTYNQQLCEVKKFLSQSSSSIIELLAEKMAMYSENQDYEQAAIMRDHIKLLRSMQRKSSLEANHSIRIDVLAIEKPFIHHIMIFDGKVQSSQFYTFSDQLDHSDYDLVEHLMIHLYLDLEPQWLPTEVLTSHYEFVISLKNQKIKIRKPNDLLELKWFDLAKKSLEENIKNQREKSSFFTKRFANLQEKIGLPQITKLLCLDISHFQGDQTVAAFVACDSTGFLKKEYRKFIITYEKQLLNDDYYSIYQATVRYFSKQNEEDLKNTLLLIDGGKGQLKRALEALQSLQLTIPTLAIAKDHSRKWGLEKLIQYNKEFDAFEELEIQKNDGAFSLITQLRDEAHRFVINFLKKKIHNKFLSSPLDELHGIGKHKKELLLQSFGGWQGLKAASKEQIMHVKGIGLILAEKIFEFLQKHQS